MRDGSLAKDFYRRLDSSVEQQFRSPIEIILLTRVDPCCLFILADRSQWIVQLLVEIAQQPMRICVVCIRKHLLQMRAGLYEVTTRFVSKRQIVSVCTISRIDLVGLGEKRDRFPRLSRAKIEHPKPVIRFETPRQLSDS